MDVTERIRLVARYQTIIKASALIVKLNELDGHVLPQFVGEMESLRLPLMRIIAEKDRLSPIAERVLASLNAGIEWQKTRDREVYKRMVSEYQASDKIAQRLSNEVKSWL